MRAMLTCRDTQGRLRGLSPGVGSGWELALPRGAPGVPQVGQSSQPSPCTPSKGCSPARPTEGFFCPPKRCVTCKETPRGSELWPGCFHPPKCKPEAIPGSGVSLLHRLLEQPLHWKSAMAKGAATGTWQWIWFWVAAPHPSSSPATKKRPQAAASSSHLHPSAPTSWQSRPRALEQLPLTS